MQFCQNCGSQIPEGSAFCNECGAKLDSKLPKRICPNCNNEIGMNMIFCDKCGAKYIEKPTISHSYNPPIQQPSYTRGYTYVPSVPTGMLTALSIICILMCWPAAIYGFICRTRAKNATTSKEANDFIHSGTTACVIGIVIVFVIMIACL